MSDVYTVAAVGRTQEVTPEGYLLCRDVPISRCGTLLYAAHELPEMQAQSGIIYAERLPDDVFAPHSIASFAGKPVIYTHEGGELGPESWRDHMQGVVLNPRRGEGNQEMQLIADLLIYDKEVIARIRDTPNHQVSAGYSAEYEQLAPGRVRQYDIIGNHVALVENGRCGPRCSIGDEAMPTPAPRPRLRLNRPRLADPAAIRRAFRTRDEAALEEALEGQPDDGSAPPDDGGMPDDGAAGATHHITVNIHGTGAQAADGPPDGDPAMGPDPTAPPAAAAPGEAIPSWAQALMARLDAIEATIAGLAGGDEGGGEEPEAPPQETKDEGGEESEEEAPPKDEEDDKTPTKDGTMTKDAAADMRTQFQAARAAAELILPGIRMPTFDAKATLKASRDTLCSFRRTAMEKGLAEGAPNRERLLPLIGGRNLKAMTCDTVQVMFDASAEMLRALNNQRVAAATAPRHTSNPTTGGFNKTLRDINNANRAAAGLPLLP